MLKCEGVDFRELCKELNQTYEVRGKRCVFKYVSMHMTREQLCYAKITK